MYLSLSTQKVNNYLSWNINRPYSFKTIRTVSEPSGQFQNRPESFRTVRTVSEPSGRFQNRPDSFRASGKFCNSLDSFKTVRTVLNSAVRTKIRLSRLKELHSYCVDVNQSLNRWIGLFGMISLTIRAKTFRTRKFFPDSNASLL